MSGQVSSFLAMIFLSSMTDRLHDDLMIDKMNWTNNSIGHYRAGNLWFYVLKHKFDLIQESKIDKCTRTTE